MSKRIPENTEVMIVMSENRVFPWQEEPWFPAKLHWTPAGEGDTFIFEVDGVGKVAINGNSPRFVGFYER